MKWPTLSDKKKLHLPEDQNCYVYFDSETEIQKQFGLNLTVEKGKSEYFWHEHTLDKQSKDHLWVSYELPSEMNETQQREYKIFCSGWLQFYDLFLRSGLTDHLVYFVWTKESRGTGKNHYYVNIYLDPAPLKKTIKKSPKVADNGKGGEGDNSFEQVDPPPVPKPPPPPRN